MPTPGPTRSLRQQQSLFVKLLGQLYVWVYDHDGWQLTLGDGYRPDRLGHMPGSLHYIRLAQDLNLFVDNVWKDKACAEWDEVGRFWKSLDKDAKWGGDFVQKDYNHVSLAWGGKA